jgi:hypothetical protein
LCKRRLGALLECTAISNATENAGNELRIVDIAEPVEHLVILAEIDIEARIEGITMLV